MVKFMGHSHIQQLLAYGQASLCGFLVLCYALIPRYMLTEGGVSNYGTRALTIVPYTLAFSLSALLTAYAAQQLPHLLGSIGTLRLGLNILAVLLALILISTYPYHIDHFWALVHARVFMLLVGFELLLSVFLVAKIRHSGIMYLLLTTQFLGAILLAMNLGGIHILFIAQQIVGVSFGILLILAAAALPEWSTGGTHDAEESAVHAYQIQHSQAQDRE